MQLPAHLDHEGIITHGTASELSLSRHCDDNHHSGSPAAKERESTETWPWARRLLCLTRPKRKLRSVMRHLSMGLGQCPRRNVRVCRCKDAVDRHSVPCAAFRMGQPAAQTGRVIQIQRPRAWEGRGPESDGRIQGCQALVKGRWPETSEVADVRARRRR